MQVALIPPKQFRHHMGLTAAQLFLPEWLSETEHEHDLISFVQQPWQTVIMDNGAAEGKKISNDEFRQLLVHYRPSEYALPDVLGDGPATVKKAQEFGSVRVRGLTQRGVKTGFVAQGTTAEEAMWSLDQIMVQQAFNQHIDVVYLPRLLVQRHNRFARLRLAEKIHKKYMKLDIHLFGASKYYVDEVLEASQMGIIRSIDTSLPYQAAAMSDMHLVDFARSSHADNLRRVDDYYNHELTDKQVQRAESNVTMYLSWAYR